MNYPIPANTEEILALGNSSVNEEKIAAAIAGVVKIARQQGQSLEDVKAGILKDDSVLDMNYRKWLSELITQAWKLLP